ncbi:hypothetical protein M8J77_019055 [Diaphorina citri]|nr:hypothetical protein M8J77_019055 [Diaphorina citri]
MSKDSSESTNKLKRKEVNNHTEKKKPEPNLTSDSIYKQTVDHEEAEAVLRNGEDDMNVYTELCAKIRSHILQLKSDGNETPAKLHSIKREVSLSFVLLKKLNRLEKYRLKNARETLQAKKSKVDSFNLQLQNLKYEIFHLKKEVVKCLQFKSKDEDIDLVDEETFFKDAPESISRPEVTKEDPHQLKLARLEWELKQRKELADECSLVERENESVAANINKKRGQLDNLAPLLKQLLSVSKPLIENLSYPENPARLQYKLAHLLPEPLYCLFIQTDAYRQAFCPSIEVKINGKEEEAEQVNKMLTEVENVLDSDSEAEEAAGNTQESSSSSKHRHHHHHHHSKSQSSQVTLKPSDKIEDKRSKLCLSHPLTVDIVLHTKGASSASLTCTFSYLYNLHVVTVKVTKTGIPSAGVAGSNHLESELLAGLFPEDNVGDDETRVTPNPANHYQLKQVGLTWDSTKLGHAYPWVQRLSGLTFPSPSSPTSVNAALAQTSVPRVVRRLAARFRSVQALATLLVQLEAGQLTGSHQCNLTSWQSLSWNQYKANDVTECHINAGYVTSVCSVYKAVLCRATAKCNAYIAINLDYPAVAPIFSVQLELPGKLIKTVHNDDAVRDIEKELNVYWKELCSNEGGESVLRAQIECLACCFDIYLECLGTKEFPRKKFFTKSARGRTRALPYKCSSRSEGLYTQR